MDTFEPDGKLYSLTDFLLATGDFTDDLDEVAAYYQAHKDDPEEWGD